MANLPREDKAMDDFQEYILTEARAGREALEFIAGTMESIAGTAGTLSELLSELLEFLRETQSGVEPE